VAVVAGRSEDYSREHPTSAALVVEVADSTLGFDRLRKQPMYARAGIPEYWIVNLVDVALDAYREPSGSGYRVHQRLNREETVSPLGASAARVRIADLLPLTSSTS